MMITRGVQDLQSCFFFSFFFFRILECVYHGGRYKRKWDFIMLEMQGKYMLPFMVIKKNPMIVLTDDKIPTRS